MTNDDRHRRRAWISNASWLTAANVFSLVVSAVVGIALVRVLGAQELGRYSLATSFVTMGTALIGFRLDQHLLTRLSHGPDDARSLAVVVQASYMLYVPAAMIAFVLAGLMLDGSDLLVAGLSIIEVGVAPLLFNRVVLQVGMRQRQALVCTAASRSVWLVLVAALVISDRASVSAVVGARILSTMVEVALLMRASGFGVTRLVMRFRPGERLAELGRAAPLAGSGLAGEFNGRIDQLLLARLYGSVELGVYAAAVRIADLAGMLAPIVQTVVAPSLIDAAKDEREDEFDAALRDGLVLTLLPSSWLVAMTMGQSSAIVRVLAGDEFARAAPLVTVVAAAEWLTFVGAAYAVALLALGRRRQLAVASTVGLVTNVAGNVIFMPEYGALAAAWMTLIGYLVPTCLVIAGMRERRGSLRRTLPVVVESVTTTALSAGVTWLTRSNIPLSIIAGTAVYFGLSLTLRRNDLAHALASLRSARAARTG